MINGDKMNNEERRQTSRKEVSGQAVPVPMSQAIKEAMEDVEQLYTSKKTCTGIPSGFPSLDRMTSGFQDGEMIVIAGRPSVGKTAFGLNIVSNLSLGGKTPVGIVTLGMSIPALTKRILSSVAGIAIQKMRTGTLRPSDFKSMTEAADLMYHSPLWIVEPRPATMSDVEAALRLMRAEHSIRLAIIDHAGNIRLDHPTAPQHEQRAEISRVFKELALKLNIPLIVLVQLRGDGEGTRPSLASIRDPGWIEEDADMIILMHRNPAATGQDPEHAHMITTELFVAKQRNGPVGSVSINFAPKYCRFESIT